IDIPGALDRLCYRYPSPLVDVITEHEPGRRLVAVKNVTVNEDFFQGHFPGAPLMPGVLMIETLAQVATVMLMHGPDAPTIERVWLRGVDNAKFRRQVVPGDRLQLEVTRGVRRTSIQRVAALASIDGAVVAEAELLLGIQPAKASRADAPLIHATAVVHPGARIGAGTVVGPFASIGEHVVIGRDCKVGASSVIDGWTEIGDGNEIFPMVSIGLVPQDLKFGGEPTRVRIGNRNVVREFVTIHRGTAGGGGLTSIGDHNLLMAYTHVAHDCHVGNETIFGNAATLAGHVYVDDYANIGAFSGVHQFCRVGRHAFIGGYSVVTKDALPFVKSVGNRARVYGINTIGLMRRGFPQDTITKLRRAYRYLLHSNTSRALTQIERDPSLRCAEVQYLVEFIRTSKRGVGLRRPSRRLEEVVDE
ncbi:MAG TPA: acyl-ACP--UDP-N-acetylglucosamine O-acyltransferase, partial [Vicinamibacterales bacterium]|nr:acyl-ACP--UDP-N-acetylglucosamine O-acyltransferase [Vicinamibacterales bacterium]